MRRDDLLSILWRRKAVVIACFLIFAVVAAVVSPRLPKSYETSTELLIVQQTQNQSFDAVQAAQVAARTYGSIVTSRNIASLVAADLGPGYSPGDLQQQVSAEPVPQTQLLRITVNDGTAAGAQRVARAYGTVFAKYVGERLAPSTKVSVEVADPAPLPGSPSKPRPTFYTALAAILGLAIGVGLALLRERLDPRIRNLADAEELEGVRILARLPKQTGGHQRDFVYAEAVRLLRTNLRFVRSQGLEGSFAVTSMREREGKSNTAGSTTVVIEGDLRRPTLQPRFAPEEIEPLRPGLADYLSGDVALEDVLYDSGVPGLTFVPAGVPVASLSSLLDRHGATGGLDAFDQLGSTTLIDLPPLEAGSDASAVAARVDGVLLIVNEPTATRAALRGAVERLTQVNATILGIVINRDSSVGDVAYGYAAEASAPERRLLRGRR